MHVLPYRLRETKNTLLRLFISCTNSANSSLRSAKYGPLTMPPYLNGFSMNKLHRFVNSDSVLPNYKINFNISGCNSPRLAAIKLGLPWLIPRCLRRGGSFSS
jgi:hypothetical protein